jgi:hypothetical protein
LSIANPRDRTEQSPTKRATGKGVQRCQIALAV